MQRPDLEWFERRLSGRQGMAIKRQMEHVRLHILLEYVKHLEEKLNETVPEVREEAGTQPVLPRPTSTITPIVVVQGVHQDQAARPQAR